MNLTNKNNEIGSQDGLGNTKNMDDMNMDKEEAFADPLGLKLDETNPIEEDQDTDEKEGADPMEEAHPEEHDEFTKNGNGKEEDSNNPTDENLEEVEFGQVDGNSERDDLGRVMKRKLTWIQRHQGKMSWDLEILTSLVIMCSMQNL